jgi:hypothetical protein
MGETCFAGRLERCSNLTSKVPSPGAFSVSILLKACFMWVRGMSGGVLQPRGKYSATKTWQKVECFAEGGKSVCVQAAEEESRPGKLILPSASRASSPLFNQHIHHILIPEREERLPIASAKRAFGIPFSEPLTTTG